MNARRVEAPSVATLNRPRGSTQVFFPIALKFHRVSPLSHSNRNCFVREAIVKVDSTSTSSLSSPKGGVQGARQGGQAAACLAQAGGSAASAQSADVSLSALSSQLRSLAASGEADIDIAQVESIKQAIADGTLTMDPGKIADGILASARELLKNSSTGS